MKGTGNHIRVLTKAEPKAASTSLFILLETILDTLAILTVRQRQAAWKAPFGQYIPGLPGDITINLPGGGGDGGGDGGDGGLGGL